MARFRKKPVEIDAWRFMGNLLGAPDWVKPEWCFEEIIPPINPGGFQRRGSPVLMIATMEGTMMARIGDWIIRGVKGEVYPCRPDIFEATYDEVK